MSRSAPTSVVVFGGLSLRPDDMLARRLQTILLPPASCGDILAAKRLQPKIIALIDGVFLHKAAVWHKEILLAMESGIRVYGSSSIGALRAAELYPFGMIGVGNIFHQYLTGELVDDDEVALEFIDTPWGIAPVSDAMVNIRASVARATTEGYLKTEEGEALLAYNKRMHFSERNLIRSLKTVLESARSQDDIKRLEQHFENGGFVDQKHEDAVALISSLLLETNLKPMPQVKVHRSVFIRKLQGEVLCSPLPETLRCAVRERKLAVSRPHFELLKRLAVLLAAADALATHEKICHASGLDAHLKHIEAWLSRTLKDDNRRRKVRSQRFLYYLLIIIDPNRAKLRRLPALGWAQRAYSWAARLWAAIDLVAVRAGVVPTSQSLTRFSDDFRRSRGLFSENATWKWCSNVGLSADTYSDFITKYERMLLLCDCFNVQLLGLSSRLEESVCWWDGALRLSDFESSMDRNVIDSKPVLGSA